MSRLLDAVSTAIIDVILYIVMTVLWFIIAGIIGGLLGAITGRRITYPQPPSFAAFRARANNRYSLFNNRQPHTVTTNTGRPHSKPLSHYINSYCVCTGGSFHLGLYDRFTGRTVDTKGCTVEWNNTDKVGVSTVATIHVSMYM